MLSRDNQSADGRIDSVFEEREDTLIGEVELEVQHALRTGIRRRLGAPLVAHELRMAPKTGAAALLLLRPPPDGIHAQAYNHLVAELGADAALGRGAVLSAELGDRVAGVRVGHAHVDAGVGGAPGAPLDLEGGEDEDVGDEVDKLLARVAVEQAQDRVLVGRVLHEAVHLLVRAVHLPPLGRGGVAGLGRAAVLLEEGVDDALEGRLDFRARAPVQDAAVVLDVDRARVDPRLQLERHGAPEGGVGVERVVGLHDAGAHELVAVLTGEDRLADEEDGRPGSGLEVVHGTHSVMLPARLGEE
ncbi:hypothetical protein PG997_012539 [Apiospora hydei]|uniref:Uncharacterized protein n=1 Tax=Apiospora hydei TaxID=1337664 RepID=A0ABR1V3M1_9PEZI